MAAARRPTAIGTPVVIHPRWVGATLWVVRQTTLGWARCNSSYFHRRPSTWGYPYHPLLAARDASSFPILEYTIASARRCLRPRRRSRRRPRRAFRHTFLRGLPHRRRRHLLLHRRPFHLPALLPRHPCQCAIHTKRAPSSTMRLASRPSSFVARNRVRMAGLTASRCRATRSTRWWVSPTPPLVYATSGRRIARSRSLDRTATRAPCSASSSRARVLILPQTSPRACVCPCRRRHRHQARLRPLRQARLPVHPTRRCSSARIRSSSL